MVIKIGVLVLKFPEKNMVIKIGVFGSRFPEKDGP